MSHIARSESFSLQMPPDCPCVYIDTMNSVAANHAFPVLFYDSECPLCCWAVRFVLAHEKTSSLRFAKLSSPLARRLVDQHSVLRGVDSVIWVDQDAVGTPIKIAIRSSAVIRIARYLGGWWSVLCVAWIIPKPLRDTIYNLVARNRRRILAARKCQVIPPEYQYRFLP